MAATSDRPPDRASGRADGQAPLPGRVDQVDSPALSGGGSGSKAKREIAIAINHERGNIPTIVAKGEGKNAQRILDIAFASGVKVRTDADLAEFLRTIELDCPIPVGCFEAVAEILRYLYSANAAARPQPAPTASPPAPSPTAAAPRG